MQPFLEGKVSLNKLIVVWFSHYVISFKLFILSLLSLFRRFLSCNVFFLTLLSFFHSLVVSFFNCISVSLFSFYHGFVCFPFLNADDDDEHDDDNQLG